MTDEEYMKWLQRFDQMQATYEIDPSRITALQIGLATLRYIEAVEERDCRKFDRLWLENEMAMLSVISRRKP